jgi:Bacterial protein of unknown function (DUF899)
MYTRERPGISTFALNDGVVYHTYSTYYARGLDGLWSMYQWLDRAPRGRNETDVWWRRHDVQGLSGTEVRQFLCVLSLALTIGFPDQIRYGDHEFTGFDGFRYEHLISGGERAHAILDSRICG